MPLTAGSRLGPYEVLGLLGAGGMGEVYRAHDPRLGRDVALKVILTEGEPSAERLKRFEDEARAVARLSHPNVLAVFDVGAHDGRPYVVFELLEGETLRQRLRTRAASAALRGGDGDPGVPGAAGGARAGDPAPGPQAGEPVPDVGRVREDPGLRPGEAHAGGRGARARRREYADRDGPRRGDGDAGLPVAGAGAGGRGGRAVGPLRAGGDSLRGALGTAGLLGGDGGGDDLGDPARGPAAGADGLGAAAATRWSRSCGAAWRRSRRTASTRRTIWPSRSRRFWTGPPRWRSPETTARGRARTPASAPSPRRTRTASSGGKARSRRSGSASGRGGFSR